MDYMVSSLLVIRIHNAICSPGSCRRWFETWFFLFRGFAEKAGLGGFTAIGKSGAKGRWRTNQAKVEFTPLDCGYTTLYETGMPKVGHAIENIARDLRLCPLIGQTPGGGAPTDDGLVPKHPGLDSHFNRFRQHGQTSVAATQRGVIPSSSNYPRMAAGRH